jgi:hypothetical protein
MTVECQYCRRPEPGTCRVESRHTTSEGVVVYVRCACGRLQRHLVSTAEMRSWYRPAGADRIPAVTAAEPTLTVTAAGPAPEPDPAVTAA